VGFAGFLLLSMIAALARAAARRRPISSMRNWLAGAAIALFSGRSPSSSRCTARAPPGRFSDLSLAQHATAPRHVYSSAGAAAR